MGKVYHHKNLSKDDLEVANTCGDGRKTETCHHRNLPEDDVEVASLFGDGR
jgi:hypothetical protein